MSLTTPHRSRERVLGYGYAGSGKSQLLIDAARNTNGRLWIIDTDRAWDRMIDGAPDIEDKIAGWCDVRLEAHTNDRGAWAVMTEAITKFGQQMAPEDFLGIDMATIAWPWCQAAFAQSVYGKSIDEFMLTARKNAVALKEETSKGSSASAFEGMTDWPTINRIWDTQLVDPLLLARGHVICTAEQDQIKGKGPIQDDDVTQAMFGAIGMKPKCQKGFAHQFHTVLYMTTNLAGQWVATTAKDRIGRDRFTLKPFDVGFSTAYLKDVAGWRQEAAVRASKGRQKQSGGTA
jgi:hypothetical protein